MYIFLCVEFNFLPWGNPPPPILVDQGILIVEASRSHPDTHTFGKTPLEEWSAWRRDIYLMTHTLQKTDFPVAAGFEPAITTNEIPQTLILEQYIQNRPHSYTELLLLLSSSS